MIYFDQELKQRVFSLFADSLRPNGFLCLGMKETLNYSQESDAFDEVAQRENIYCRKAATPCMRMTEEVFA